MTMLPTFSDLPIASPLAKAVSGLPDAEQAQVARDAVGLGEISGWTLLHVRSSDVETLKGPAEIKMKIGDVVALSNESKLARLRRDEFLVLARHEGRIWLDRLSDEPGVTVTDITLGRCGLLLVGRNAPDVLAKVCALDFTRQFPNLHAAQTSLAKVRTLIIRADIDETTPTYALIVDRSLAAYVWDMVFDATREFGGIALSSSGLDQLRKTSLW